MKLECCQRLFDWVVGAHSRNSRPFVSHGVGRLFVFFFLSCFDCLGEVSSSLGVQFIKYGGMRVVFVG